MTINLKQENNPQNNLEKEPTSLEKSFFNIVPIFVPLIAIFLHGMILGNTEGDIIGGFYSVAAVPFLFFVALPGTLVGVWSSNESKKRKNLRIAYILTFMTFIPPLIMFILTLI
jgi:hypothetical protein